MSANPPQSVYRRSKDVSFTRFGEEMLVVVPSQSLNFVLNGSGARVLELVDGRRSVADIAAELADEYQDAPAAEIENDVADLLRDLQEKGAVVAPAVTT